MPSLILGVKIRISLNLLIQPLSITFLFILKLWKDLYFQSLFLSSTHYLVLIATCSWTFESLWHVLSFSSLFLFCYIFSHNFIDSILQYVPYVALTVSFFQLWTYSVVLNFVLQSRFVALRVNVKLRNLCSISFNNFFYTLVF